MSDAVAGEKESAEAREMGEIPKGGDIVVGEVDRILILGGVSIGSGTGYDCRCQAS
jgi:hypothetical protein